MKKCTKCNTEKDECEFVKSNRNRSGLTSRCRMCSKKYYQEHRKEISQYNQEHKAKRASYDKKYRQEHKEKITKYNKKYRQDHEEEIPKYYQQHKKKIAIDYRKNRETILAQRKMYYKENLESILGYKRRKFQENKNKQYQYRKKRYVNNIQFYLSTNLRARLRSALKNGSKVGSAVRDLGCTIAELKTHLESRFVNGMSWENRGKWHIDHIRPLSSFDLTDRVQFLEACNWRNLQPLWAHENMAKGGKRMG